MGKFFFSSIGLNHRTPQTLLRQEALLALWRPWTLPHLPCGSSAPSPPTRDSASLARSSSYTRRRWDDDLKNSDSTASTTTASTTTTTTNRVPIYQRRLAAHRCPVGTASSSSTQHSLHHLRPAGWTLKTTFYRLQNRS